MKSTDLGKLSALMIRRLSNTGIVVSLSDSSVHIRTADGVVFYPRGDFNIKDVGVKVRLSKGVITRITVKELAIKMYRL